MSEVSESVYLSAVKGRQDFRRAFQRERQTVARLRDALDRIARFDEAFAEIADLHASQTVGSALAETLANYARKVLSETI